MILVIHNGFVIILSKVTSRQRKTPSGESRRRLSGDYKFLNLTVVRG